MGGGGGGGGVNKTHYGLCEIGELAANMNGVAESPSLPLLKLFLVNLSAIMNNTGLVLKPLPHLSYSHQ